MREQLYTRTEASIELEVAVQAEDVVGPVVHGQDAIALVRRGVDVQVDLAEPEAFRAAIFAGQRAVRVAHSHQAVDEQVRVPRADQQVDVGRADVDDALDVERFEVRYPLDASRRHLYVDEAEAAVGALANDRFRVGIAGRPRHVGRRICIHPEGAFDLVPHGQTQIRLVHLRPADLQVPDGNVGQSSEIYVEIVRQEQVRQEDQVVRLNADLAREAEALEVHPRGVGRHLELDGRLQVERIRTLTLTDDHGTQETEADADAACRSAEAQHDPEFLYGQPVSGFR